MTARRAHVAGYGEGPAATPETQRALVDALVAVDAFRDFDVAERFAAALVARHPAAAAALETAALDLQAREAHRPLAVHLGGTLRPVPAASTVPPVAADEARRIAERAGADRVRVVVVQVGGGDLDGDLARLAAVRGAAAAAELRVDAQGSWSLRDVERAGPTLDRLAVAWLVDPVPGNDLAALAAARRVQPVKVMVDRAASGAADVARLAEAKAADGVDLRVASAGGLRRCIAAAEAAVAHGLVASLRAGGEGRIGVAAAAHAWCATRAFTLAELPHVHAEAHGAEGGFVAKDGVLRLLDAPGHGAAPVSGP